ncbi:hypothetical protein ACPCKQ_18755 [Bacillus bombysepticus]
MFEHLFAFNFLIFESVHWQYILGIDKRVFDTVTAETLVVVANPIPE